MSKCIIIPVFNEYENINITNFNFTSKDFDKFYKDKFFDLIIGNPPYLSLEKGFLKNEIEDYKKEFATIFKVYDIFGIFIEIIIFSKVGS